VIKGFYFGTHAAIIHTVTFVVFLIRDVAPLATNKVPKESNPVIWALLVVLAFTGCLTPLFVNPSIQIDDEAKVHSHSLPKHCLIFASVIESEYNRIAILRSFIQLFRFSHMVSFKEAHVDDRGFASNTSTRRSKLPQRYCSACSLLLPHLL